MHKRLWLSIVMAAVGAALLAAAATAGGASSPQSKSSAAKRGGTLRVNLSTTDVEFTDPALEYETTGWQLEYATALKLLNWRETKAQLFPEAAAAFPRIGAGGRIYTFTIRRGLRLSNNERVTAANFKTAFARALDPKMNSPALAFIDDISSVTAKGLKLTIRLKRPRPDFGSIVSMPFFQAVPKSMAHDPQGVKIYASGGPYFICGRDVGRSIVLCRNKHYTGKRPRNPNTITITVNTDLNTSLLQVEKNQRDYDMFGVPPTAHQQLHSRYSRQYHIEPGIITDYLSMNSSYGSKGKGKSIFNGYAGAGLRSRKAVNYAVNRPATLKARGAFAGTPTNQILPPTMPGYHNWKKAIGYPTGRPNATKARAQKPSHGTVVFYASTSPVSTLIVQIVKANIGAIGMNADIKQYPFAVRIKKEGHKGEPYDLDLQAWGADYPDPVDFIDILLDGTNIHGENNNNNAYFNNAKFNRRMALAGRLVGAKRYAAWAAIDRDVMKQQAPLAPLFFRTVREFTSKRLIGCYSYQPIYASMNFNAACIK
jgi:ABC-type oligopeptide transport system substrate-binding subunit